MGAKAMGSHGVQRHTLIREGSLYSLTLAEVENQLCNNLKKPLGSMNLDELLKTVWTVEASQRRMELSFNKQPSQIASSSSVRCQPRCQPSLVMSSELSNKTVDEVWKHIQIQNDRVKQLSEMTLEEFLVKAGIVARDDHGDLFGDDEEGEYIQQSHWMQCQLSPVGETQTCLQQLRPSMSGFMASNKRVQQPILTMGVISDTQTLGRKRVAPGEVIEKNIERRQKRMIKNRESAARSRARKQAYTNELENKISYLEEEIERLKKQQDVEKEVICAPQPEQKHHHHHQLRRTNSGPL